MTATSQNYDTRSIALHWATAALVIVLWCLGQTIDWFPKGTPRLAARSTHICIGVAIGLILFYRIVWRATEGRRLPAAGSPVVAALSKFVHVMLYATLVATVILGIANTWVRGDNIFNLFTVPAFDPGNKVLRGQVEDLHSWLANFLVILAGIHAAAGLTHHFLWKDGVLRRMLPARG